MSEQEERVKDDTSTAAPEGPWASFICFKLTSDFRDRHAVRILHTAIKRRSVRLSAINNVTLSQGRSLILSALKLSDDAKCLASNMHWKGRRWKE